MTTSERNTLIDEIIYSTYKGVGKMDGLVYNDKFTALDKLTDEDLKNEKNVVARYKDYTIQKDWRNPYDNSPEFMFYKTSEGIQHDADCTDGESFIYCGNCEWASTLEFAKIEIDSLIEQEFEEVSVCPHCDAPTVERSSGDEGFTFCSEDCGCLEGEKSVYKFICPDCEEVKDEAKCDCKRVLEPVKLH